MVRAGDAALVIPRRYLEEMTAHALEERPNECCGVLAGPLGRVAHLYRSRNAEASPRRYSVDSRELFQIHRDIEDRGWELLGVYHSHTHSEAYPSPTDVQLALWPDALYFIVSLKDSPPRVRAFRIRDGVINEESFQVASPRRLARKGNPP